MVVSVHQQALNTLLEHGRELIPRTKAVQGRDAARPPLLRPDSYRIAQICCMQSTLMIQTPLVGHQEDRGWFRHRVQETSPRRIAGPGLDRKPTTVTPARRLH